MKDNLDWEDLMLPPAPRRRKWFFVGFVIAFILVMLLALWSYLSVLLVLWSL